MKKICQVGLQILNNKMVKQKLEEIALKGHGKIIAPPPTRIEMQIPHKKDTLTFVYPLIKPRRYDDIEDFEKSVYSKGFLIPTTAQAISLLDVAMKNPKEKHCKEILYALDVGGMLTSTQYVCVTDFEWKECGRYEQRIIYYDNPDGKIRPIKKRLIEYVKKRDKRFKCVQDYSNNCSFSNDIGLKINNPHITAQVGKGMTSKLKRVANCRGDDPSVNCWIPWAYSFGNFKASTYLSGSEGISFYGTDPYGGSYTGASENHLFVVGLIKK